MLFPGLLWFPRNDAYLSDLIKLLLIRPVYLDLVLNRVTFFSSVSLKTIPSRRPKRNMPR